MGIVAPPETRTGIAAKMLGAGFASHDLKSLALN
jgi:hypothetical protein